MLYVVSTPIGNLKDITLRALDILASVDLVVSEDTRTTQKLLKRYEIKARLLSYNDYNKRTRTKQILNKLEAGCDVALVSESGTPAISDPGYYLIRECIKHGFEVVPVPGACAVTAALVASGLPTDSFTFIGFLPKKKGKKHKLLEELKNQQTTVVFFESPHRLAQTLESLRLLYPEWWLAVCRELTKLHEEVVRGTVAEVAEKLSKVKPRGEYTLVLSPKHP